MTSYDVVFLHPPSVISPPPFLKRFRRKTSPCPYLIMPMGLVSMASILEDNGFKTRIFNLGLEHILSGKDIKKILKGIDSKIYAIDLHWFVTSDGSIETAKICKRLYPNSNVILGGFTASIFDIEIMKDYRFVDVIIRGEGENAILKTCREILAEHEPKDIKGITYRIGKGIKRNSMGHTTANLDNLDFTRIELIENVDKYLRVSINDYIPNKLPAYWLTIGRGDPYRCAYCGGGSENYKSIMGRYSMIFRSPNKVVEDIATLRDKGVKIIRFGQDLEIGGKKYYGKILQEIEKEKIDVAIYNESWCKPPSLDFIRRIKKTFHSRNLVVSPETASDAVRRGVNRVGTTRQILRILDILESEEILTDVYFLIGLPGETKESVKDILRMADKISKKEWVWVAAPFPFTIDPNSPISKNPSSYGVKLFFRTFKDYKNAFRSPDPIDWIGHETETMTRREIIAATLHAQRYISSLNQPAMLKKYLFEMGFEARPR